MTTGHVLPGYGPVVTNITRHRRTRSADPTVSSYQLRGGHSLREPALGIADPVHLAQIKQDAREAWHDSMKDWMETPEKRPTTYAHSFYRKGPLESEDPVIMRPTSPTRRNKPHPKGVFMKCRLHKVPGYHDPYNAMGQEMNVVEGFQNADTQIGDDVYIVDALCNDEEQHGRQRLRQKFVGRPSTVAVSQYQIGQREASLKRFMNDPRGAQAAEAWMKLANDRDKAAAQTMLYKADVDRRKGYYNPNKPKPFYNSVKIPYHASVHRFLKTAGNEEAKAAENLLRASMGPKPPSMSGPHYHITDYSSRSLIKINPKTTRKDFTYHPEFYP